MTISVFDLFKVGIGPSSSHTVGPMKAAYLFVDGLRDDGLLDQVAKVHVELFGSLGATGHGHGSVKAVVLGLSGEQPHLVDPVAADPMVQDVRDRKRLDLAGTHGIDFDPDDDVVMHRRKRLEFHTNGMVFQVFDAAGAELRRREYYSVGGGFVLGEDDLGNPALVPDETPVPYPFHSGDELLAITRSTGLRISDVMLANELVRRSEDEVRSELLAIWQVMRECVDRGSTTPGVLPGGLRCAVVRPS
jgi:L-serine dehydratase